MVQNNSRGAIFSPHCQEWQTVEKEQYSARITKTTTTTTGPMAHNLKRGEEPMLPAEFKKGDYRFSFRRHTPDGENWVYGGSRLIDGRYVFIAELAVKKTTTKPALHRLFLMIENAA